MRLVIQRVSKASVSVNNQIVGAISHGLLILLGVSPTDTQASIEWLIPKVIQLRIFNDDNGKMNLSVQDVKGSILVVSQFTLFADCKKGNRPSFAASAPPDQAKELYEKFLSHLKNSFAGKIESGIFAASMNVELINQGPVTIILDSPV